MQHFSTSTHSETKVSSNKNKVRYIDPTVSGIDIGLNVIHVSILQPNNKVTVTEFKTDTASLNKIADTLKNAGVKTAVMEATGVYWVPLYEILEQEGLEAVLVDAKSVKNVPGRKTDVQDAQWIQTLYSSGLIIAAFRPERSKIPLREYVRDRSAIIDLRKKCILQIDKRLQLMNIKLSSVVSDIFSISGLKIIRAIANGEQNPVALANLKLDSCKRSTNEFIDALTGNFQEYHINILKRMIKTYDFLETQLADCDELIRKALEELPEVTGKPLPKPEKSKETGKTHRKSKPKKNSFSFDLDELLWRKSGIHATAIDGIRENTALTLFAELGGIDMKAWKSEKEFSSWLKLCPGNNISGGKARKSKHQPCVNRASQAFRMAALAAKNSNSAIGGYIRAQCGRSDNPRGIKAGAHKLCRLYYFMCKYGWEYSRKSTAEFEAVETQRRLKRLEKSAKKFGMKLVSA